MKKFLKRFSMIILCGGRGKRLGEITKRIPKKFLLFWIKKTVPFSLYIFDILRKIRVRIYVIYYMRYSGGSLPPKITSGHRSRRNFTNFEKNPKNFKVAETLIAPPGSPIGASFQCSQMQ